MIERRQIDAFEAPGRHDRESWLRSIFSQKIAFTYFSTQFHYVPEVPSDDADDNLIVGRIGRQITVRENEPPDSGLHEMHRDTWRAGVFILDPRHHEDGQKAALEKNAAITDPLKILTALATAINLRQPPEPYGLEVAAITEASTFWDFVNANRGRVTSVSFDLVTPNMFDGPENMDQELRAMRDNEHARRAKLSLENPDGLELNTDRIRGIVDYAAKGGGDIEARAKGRKSYNSRRKIRRAAVPVPDDDESLLAEVVEFAKKIIFSL